MKKIEEVLGDVVRRRRGRFGLSQEAYAVKAGIHRTYASLIERGKVQVTIGMIQKLATALEVPMSVLLRDVEKELGGSPAPKRR